MNAKIAIGLLLLAVTAAAPTTAAEPISVGDCAKYTCAAVCVDGVADCAPQDLVCVGVSYQTPACVGDASQSTMASSESDSTVRCASEVCEVVNVVCWKVLKFQCLA